jgi:hypothetical protein
LWTRGLVEAELGLDPGLEFGTIAPVDTTIAPARPSRNPHCPKIIKSNPLTESDGELVTRWLPLEPFVGSLDRGGFAEYTDAKGFALGVDPIRAEHGLLGELDARDIDRERGSQDGDQRGRARALRLDHPLFEAA